MDKSSHPDVLVVGGGIIGLSCALALQKQGQKVMVVDQARVAAGAALRNCGLITPSFAIPLCRPGTMSRALKLMFRRDSPLCLHPTAFLRDPAWFARFAAFCRPEAVRRAAVARAALLQRSRQLFPEFTGSDPAAWGWRAGGTLYVFRTEAGLQHFSGDRALLRDLGIGAEFLTAEALPEVAPGLRPELAGGWLFPDDAHLQPDLLLQVLREKLQQGGCRFLEDQSRLQLQTAGQRVTGLRSPGADLSAGRILLTAGTGTAALLRPLGIRLPLLPGHGYSVTFPRPPVATDVPLHFEEDSVVATPFADGWRLGGTMEFTGGGPKPGMEAIRLAAIRRAASGWLTEDARPRGEGISWHGERPMTPDGLPYMGDVPPWEGLFVAAGHNMLGLSMAPATAEFMGAVMSGSPPFTGADPFHPLRFG